MRLRRTHLILPLAILLLAPGALLGSASVGLTPAEAPATDVPLLGSRVTGSLSYTEPSIDITPDGRIFVTAISGLPSRSPIWEMTGATTWTLRGTNVDRNGEIGGGDADLEFDSQGRGYHSDLWLGNDGISVSDDGISWTGAPVSHYVFGNDRQWFAHYQDQYLFTVTNQLAAGAVLYRADIGGPAGEAGAFMATLEVPFNCRCGPPGFPIVDQNTGVLYAPLASGNSLLMYKFAPSTTTFTGFQISAQTVSTAGNPANIFPVAAVDEDSNVYVAYSQQQGGKHHIYVAKQAAATSTWTVHKVNSFDGTHVMPWIVAGAGGKIGVAWYGTGVAGNPNAMPAGTPWYVYYSQSTNMMAASPTFTEYNMTLAHTGSISLQGLFGSSDRSLGDFMSAALDPTSGKVHMAFIRNAAGLTAAERGLWHMEQPAAAASLL